MTREQLEQRYIERDGNTFTPRYTYAEIYLEDGRVDYDYTITATAEEVYKEWLEQKDKPQEQPTNKTEIRLEQIESAVGELATLVAQNTLLK